MAASNVTLSSIGVKISIGEHEVAKATSFGDLGGKPDTIDATCLTDKVKVSKPGVQSQDAWEVKYLWNAEDVAALDALDTAGASVPVEVTFPNGAKYANTGIPSNYAGGAELNQMLTATCSVMLDGKWKYTAAPAS